MDYQKKLLVVRCNEHTRQPKGVGLLFILECICQIFQQIQSSLIYYSASLWQSHWQLASYRAPTGPLVSILNVELCYILSFIGVLKGMDTVEP